MNQLFDQKQQVAPHYHMCETKERDAQTRKSKGILEKNRHYKQMRMKEVQVCVCVLWDFHLKMNGEKEKDNTKTTNNGEIILIYSIFFFVHFGNGGRGDMMGISDIILYKNMGQFDLYLSFLCSSIILPQFFFILVCCGGQIRFVSLILLLFSCEFLFGFEQVLINASVIEEDNWMDRSKTTEK